jgi:hypothetical protein
MTETTEETIARIAKERAKTILENSDYWSGPGPAKTSAEAVGTLLSYRWQLELPPLALPDEKAPVEESPAVAVKEKRIAKAKEQAAATTETNGEPESTDV